MVKSEYHYFDNQNQSSKPSGSNYNFEASIWKKTWNINTQPIIKTLFWRIINAVFPNWTELNKRGINCPRFWHICLTRGEYIDQIFKNYDWTIKYMVWFCSQY